ncbi:MAG: RNA-binding S4 domain-containing protein [Litorilinea sp.]
MTHDTTTHAPIPEPEYIKLDQFLKLAGVVRSGGEAKVLIQAGKVTVNGAVETRRGRKLYHGDQINALGEELVMLTENDEETGAEDLADEE